MCAIEMFLKAGERAFMKIIENSQRGQAVIEFALVLPFMLLILGGIIEFGILFYNKQVIANASREAARAGIIYLVDKTTGNKIIPDIEKVARDYCNGRLITFGAPAQPIVTPTSPTGLSFPKDLTVQVQYQYTFMLSNVMDIFGTNMGPTLNLRAQTVMRME